MNLCISFLYFAVRSGCDVKWNLIIIIIVDNKE